MTVSRNGEMNAKMPRRQGAKTRRNQKSPRRRRRGVKPAMKRRLFNALTVLSLLLCFAIAGLWVRSYWMGDTLEWYRIWWILPPEGGNWTTYRYASLMSARGGICLQCGVEEWDYHNFEMMAG